MIIGAVIAGAQTAVSTVNTVTGAVSGVGQSTRVDNFKSVWSNVSNSEFLRLTGGHGQWKDWLTGEVMDDFGSDTRKIAVCASGMGMYVDAKQRMFFPDGRPVEPADSWAAWTSRYGNVSFADAYRANPAAFRVYGASPANDPVIGAMSPPPASVPTVPVSSVPITPTPSMPAGTPTPFPLTSPAAAPAPAPPAGQPAITPNAAAASTAAAAQQTPWYLQPMALIGGAAIVVALALTMRKR